MTKKAFTTKSVLFLMLFLLLMMSILAVSVAASETEDETVSKEEEIVTPGEEWVSFFMICNEGMSSRGGNSGNTMMVISMNEKTGTIRLMMFTWDTFVDYEGYDLPQKIDMAYRNNGPEGTMEVFNANFDLDIDKYMSLNYLNLATLIDIFGGVTVEVSRAERNALNAMVSSKKENIQAMADANLLDQIAVELLAKEYYLTDFGQETHLNGLQAVAYGWLQYDSVYNCCLRDAQIVASLFRSAGTTLKDEVVFYTDEYEKPELEDSRRIINLDHVTDEDMDFLRQAISPIFEMAYNNLTEEDIESITLTLARISYMASRQGADILDQMKYDVFPLEAKNPYDEVAGAKGHLVNQIENSKAMKKFLYGTDSMEAIEDIKEE